MILVLLLLLSGPLFPQEVPQLKYQSVPDFLKLPQDMYLGEVAGVAVNSKGHVFVFSRGDSTGPAYGAGAAQLLEFGADGKFIREIGHRLYAWSFAHSVKVDRDDNIWAADKGSDMVIKFNPEGRVLMVFGRKQEASDEGTEPLRHPKPPLPPVDGMFRQVTDMAWDAGGNTYISDGYINSRVAKIDKDGNWLNSWGEPGEGPGQFHTPHSIAVDEQGRVYVADRGNRRIQVFDGEGNFKSQIGDIGAPWTLCISPGAHQYLYSSNSNPPDSMDNGEIYKMELDGKVLGKFGTAGKLVREFGTVNEIDCRNPNTLYVGELTNWRVQKLTLK